MAKNLEGLQQLFVEELQDLYDAEKQLVKAIPRMAKSATDEELENALRNHLEVTRGQVQRIEQVFESMDMRARSRPCAGMKGLVEEGQEIIQQEQEEGILDTAITGAARKVEHYEMVGYESARSLAQLLGMREAAQLLQETLQEEAETDRQLSQISKRLLKEASRRGSSAEQESEGGRRSSATRGGNRTTQSRQSGGRSRGSSGRASTRRSSGRSSSRTSSRGSSRSSSRRHSAHPLTDHEEIRNWAEDRGAHPACVRGTGGHGDTGMIRLDFPGYTGEDKLQPISWDEWFEKFDEKGLALMVQDTTSGGEKSNFNKLVSRESASEKSARPKARAAR